MALLAAARASWRGHVSLPLLYVLLTWCLFCIATPPSTMMAAAQGSAAATTGICTFNVWMTTTPAPGAVVYPPGTVSYERQNFTLPPEPFFLVHWYVAIVLILCAVCGFYILLALWVLYHFDLYAQHQAKKVVGDSYAVHGYFDLKSKGARRSRSGSARSHRGSSSDSSSSSSSSGSRSGRRSNTTASHVPASFDRYADDRSSYSSRESTSSPSPSESDDAVVEVNPLQRRARRRTHTH
ncbi:hypothetical protein NESM_000255400 [Novymonas esmeraldas]|uniref:Uncharacterized protein n=1 Tax=Novymonas esmeraldas TaxID=1808958 RepID=A0AAW0F5M8_9TRYP